MARLTIPDEPTSIDFTVTTAQSAFPIAFALFDKADLKVSAGGRTVSPSGFTFVGDRLEGGGYKGGIVHLNDPVENTTVRVWRGIKPVRPSNFSSQSSVPTRVVDMEFNKLTAQQQDIDRVARRAIRVPVNEEGQILPPADQRREKIPWFDRAGDLQVTDFPAAFNSLGGAFEDFGPWGLESDPLTKDYGAFG